jgi:hypothetical protein
MNPKADRITFHGKGCDYEFAVNPTIPPNDPKRKAYLDLCEAEWDSMNSVAIKHNLQHFLKYGGKFQGGEEDE